MMAHWGSGGEAAFVGRFGETVVVLPWTVLSFGSEERALDFRPLEHSACSIWTELVPGLLCLPSSTIPVTYD